LLNFAIKTDTAVAYRQSIPALSETTTDHGESLAARKIWHVTEFGEAFEQTSARAILQFGRAAGRRGRDGINGETGRARSRLAAGRRLPPGPSPCWRAGWVWGASRMGFCRLSKKSAGVAAERLTGNHVARLAQWTAPKAGVDNDLSEATTAKPSPTIRRAPAKTTRRKEAARRKMGHNLLLLRLLLLLFLRLATPCASFAMRPFPSPCSKSARNPLAEVQQKCNTPRNCNFVARLTRHCGSGALVRFCVGGKS
jgi:hypothetical protein